MTENDSLVAINIYNKNTKVLYNKSFVPILFYWNGKGNLLDSILNDNKFQETYLSNITDYDSYKNLIMSYFYFEYQEDGKEVYEDNEILISEHIDLNKFNSNNIVYNLVIPLFFELYKLGLKKEYNKTNIFNSDIIVDIYNQIKNKYGDKIHKNTLINWVRSKLVELNNIETKDIDYIISKISSILSNEN